MEPYLRLDLAKVGTIELGRREHRRIFQACVRQDSAAAGRHIAAHLQRTIRGFLRYLRSRAKAA
jgi:DNA-binding GntR family transcriptional regulator